VIVVVPEWDPLPQPACAMHRLIHSTQPAEPASYRPGGSNETGTVRLF
jgi:hypothetical protein